MATDALLLKFKATESATSVTRDTVRAMSQSLGFNETQTIQYALARLRAEVLPAYEIDDGPVPEKMLKHIRKVVSQDQYRPTSSLLPGV